MAINPLIGYGLISGIGSLASSFGGAALGYKQSKDLMSYQAQLQQQAIDRQNLYNSPAEQMKRLELAHLNPNLVYGSGVDGNQSSAASPGIASRGVSIDNPLQDLGQAYLQSKQLQMQQVAARNEAFESRARRLNLEAKTLGVLTDNKLKDATLDTNIKIAAQKLSNMVAEESNINARTNNLIVERNSIVENAKLLAERTKLTQQQAITETIRQRSLQSGILLNGAVIEKIAHEIPFIDAGTNLRKLAYKMQESNWKGSKAGEQWLAEHPTIAVIENLLERIFGLAGQAMDLVP